MLSGQRGSVTARNPEPARLESNRISRHRNKKIKPDKMQPMIRQNSVCRNLFKGIGCATDADCHDDGLGRMMREDGEAAPEVDALIGKPPQLQELDELLLRLVTSEKPRA